MVGKKGFVKTLEAVIAVIIILGFVYALTPKHEKMAEAIPFPVQEVQRFVLTEVALNITYRSCITSTVQSGECSSITSPNDCMTRISSFIHVNTPAGYRSLCELCERSVSCMQQSLPIDRSIFTDSVFIGHSRSKVLRVYYWPENQ